MPVYAYRGKSRAGVEVRGEREADTKQALLAALRREQISPLMVKEKGKELSLPKLGGKVKTKELAIFTRQFSVMIDAGLPLVQCLEALAQQQENKVFAGVLQAVRTEVEGGSTLAYAMSQHPKVFDSLYTNMIAAGEAGGILDTILQRLSSYIEKAVKLKTCRAVGHGLSSGSFVDRRRRHHLDPLEGGTYFRQPVCEFGRRAAPADAHRYRHEQFCWAVHHFHGSCRYRARLRISPLLSNSSAGRMTVDRLMLKVPVLGNVLRKIAVARFSRTLSTLITSGVPILEGLAITARTAGNAVIETSNHGNANIHRTREDHCRTPARVGSVSRRW